MSHRQWESRPSLHDTQQKASSSSSTAPQHSQRNMDIQPVSQGCCKRVTQQVQGDKTFQAATTAMRHSMVPASDSGMLPSRPVVLCSLLGSMPGCRMNIDIQTRVSALCHAATVLALTPAAHCTHPIHQHQGPAAACAPSALKRAKYKVKLQQ
jgi:hypothetical protein